MMHTKDTFSPLPFLAAALLILLFAMWAGLFRLGWQIPILQESLMLNHGPLMVSGFLGTLILLERAAALRMRPLYLGPLLTALGGIATIFNATHQAGALLIVTGSIADMAILLVMLRREPKIYIAAMTLGVFAWIVGNLLWLAGWPVFRVVLWWMAFLVLTISAERLELSRVLHLSARQFALYSGAVMIFLAGVILNAFNAGIGARVSGAGIVSLALWLLRYDVAPRNVRIKSGLTRFIAWCLLAGYLWLAISGALLLLLGLAPAGLYYDAVLHAVFLGFVISMIFGHAPIILPGLLQIPVAYRKAYYVHLGLLHLSLVLRVSADLAAWPLLRQWGGLLNVTAVLLFLGMTIYSTRNAISAQRVAFERTHA